MLPEIDRSFIKLKESLISCSQNKPATAKPKEILGCGVSWVRSIGAPIPEKPFCSGSCYTDVPHVQFTALKPLTVPAKAGVGGPCGFFARMVKTPVAIATTAIADVGQWAISG